MKRIAYFIGGCGLVYGGIKFIILTYTLLAAGQFFTPILAMCFTAVCLTISGALITEAMK